MDTAQGQKSSEVSRVALFQDPTLSEGPVTQASQEISNEQYYIDSTSQKHDLKNNKSFSYHSTGHFHLQ